MHTSPKLFALALAVPLVGLPVAGCGGGGGGNSGGGGNASGAGAAGAKTYEATLRSVADNAPNASGTAMVTVDGDRLTVKVNGSGLVPGAPHAQHIHIGGQHVCPSKANDKNGDGIVSVTEGAPSYGPIKVSLTTSGDVSAKSGLAVKRFPVAQGGNESYSRTFTLPAGVSASDVANGVVVVHGIDHNGNGKYDFSAGKSDLMPKLPLEATSPAICGKLVAMR